MSQSAGAAIVAEMQKHQILAQILRPFTIESSDARFAVELVPDLTAL
jgi:hypothetical protein